MDKGMEKWLTARFGRRVRFGEPMAVHTSLKVGGPAQALVVDCTEEDMPDLCRECGKREIPFLVVGRGTNLLVTDAGIEGVVAILKKEPRKTIRLRENGKSVVIVPAGAGIQSLCGYALSHGLSGMNFALGIPGSIGGAVCMNAGTRYGAISDVLEFVRVILPDGQIRTLEKDELSFGYRRFLPGEKTIPLILEGGFGLLPADGEQLKKEARQIMIERKNHQPIRYPNAGCFFKNPPEGPQAGRLIDQAGLKGRRVGGAEVSRVHANFLINRGKAAASDILSLVRIIQETVEEKFGIILEQEVKIVGK